MAAIPATQTSRPWITEAIIDLTNTDDTAAWLNGLTSGGIKHCPLAAAGIEYHQEHARILLSSPRSVHSTTQPTLAQLFDELDKWNAWSHAVGLQAVRCQGDTLVLGPRQELEQTQGDRSLANHQSPLLATSAPNNVSSGLDETQNAPQPAQLTRRALEFHARVSRQVESERDLAQQVLQIIGQQRLNESTQTAIAASENVDRAVGSLVARALTAVRRDISHDPRLATALKSLEDLQGINGSIATSDTDDEMDEEDWADEDSDADGDDGASGEMEEDGDDVAEDDQNSDSGDEALRGRQARALGKWWRHL